LGSTLAGTNMSGAEVWRTSFADASLTAILEDGVKESALTKDKFAALKAMITKEVPEGGRLNLREQALKRIEKLNPAIFGPEASEQETLEKGRVDETTYRSALANQLKSLACSGAESAQHIVFGLIAYGRLRNKGAQTPGLVEAILKPDCPVSAAPHRCRQSDAERNGERGQRRALTMRLSRPSSAKISASTYL
jgi:hypothetical protein